MESKRLVDAAYAVLRDWTMRPGTKNPVCELANNAIVLARHFVSRSTGDVANRIADRIIADLDEIEMIAEQDGCLYQSTDARDQRFKSELLVRIEEELMS